MDKIEGTTERALKTREELFAQLKTELNIHAKIEETIRDRVTPCASISLFALVLMFGVYTLLDGVCTMVSTVRSHKSEKRWWLFLLQGIAGILVGIMALIWPGITAFL